MTTILGLVYLRPLSILSCQKEYGITLICAGVFQAFVEGNRTLSATHIK
jgi:hypothetical protein